MHFHPISDYRWVWVVIAALAFVLSSTIQFWSAWKRDRPHYTSLVLFAFVYFGLGLASYVFWTPHVQH